MHLCRFLFGVNEITIKTESLLSDKVASNIATLLKSFANELNSNIKDSYAYKFNRAQIGIPIKFSREFLDFLQVNKTLTLKSNFTFVPFETGSHSSKFSFDDYFRIFPEDMSIIKFQEIYLDTNLLRKYYAFDVLYAYLSKELKLKRFSLSTKGIVAVKGLWEFKDNEFPFNLLNNSTVVFREVEEQEKIVVQKFLGEFTSMSPVKIYVETTQATSSQILWNMIYKFRFPEEFKKIAAQYTAKIYVEDSEGNVKVFG